MKVSFMRKFLLLGINPAKEREKKYSSIHYRGINQVERVLSETAGADSILVVCKADKKVERNRESRLSEKIVASCLVALLVEDIMGRIYQLDRVPPLSIHGQPPSGEVLNKTAG